MKEYTVKFEMFGKKMKTTVYAATEEDAKSEKPLRSKDEPRPQREIEPTEQRSKKAEAFWKKRNKP